MRNLLLPLPLLVTALVLAHPSARALTLTFNNYNSGATAVHGIADKDAVRIAAADSAAGVIGTMKTLTDEQIDEAVAAGDLAALNADFQPFDSVSGPFSLAAFGTSGVIESALSEDTRASATNSLGGKAIYVWLYKGNSRTAATEIFLARLDSTFGTDLEDDVPLSGLVRSLRPANVARYYAGFSGPETHDYSLGGGAATLFKMEAVNVPNRAPVAQDLTIRVQPGASFSGTVPATDADGDALTFNLLGMPSKGSLNFNGGTGAFTYTAHADAEGQDSFNFTATDGEAVSNTGIVFINLGDHGLLTQTITFAQPGQRTVKSAPFTLTATSTSELPVSFQIVSGPATISGSTVTLTKAIGIVVVRALQAGDDTYAPAEPVLRSFFVTADAKTPTLGHLSQVYQGVPLFPSVAGAPEGSTVTLEFKSGTAAFTTDRPVNAGTYQVKATIVSGSTTTVRTGKFVITKANLFAKADDKEKLIGQPNPALTATYTGFLGSDDFDSVFPDPPTATAKVPTASTTAKDASAGGVYPITLKGGATQNYTLKFLPGKLTVRTFAGEYENLLPNMDLTAPGAKVDLTVASAVKLGLSGQPNTMTCTAKLWLPTESAFVSLSGKLDIDPVQELLSGTCSLSRKVGTVTTVYRIDVDVFANGSMAASASVDSVQVATGEHGRKIHVPAAKPVISYAGDHTAHLAPGVVIGTTANPLPGGTGHATGKISTKGVMTFAGKLGDGTSFTSSLKPSLDPQDDIINYRLFIYPYSKRKNSSVSGWLDLVPHPNVTGRYYIPASDAQKIYWAKEGRSTDASYPLGIAPVSCLLTLDPWRAPVAATRTVPAVTLLNRLGLAADGLFDVTHDSFTSLSFADLPTGLKLTVTPSAKVAVAAPVANLTGWKVSTLNTTTGAFTGEFTLKKETPKPRKATFSGVLRQPAAGETGTVILGAAHFILPGATTGEKATAGTLEFSKQVPVGP